MSTKFEDDSPLQRRRKPICRVCGGYGINFNSEHGNAMRCPSCGGDKMSRDPHDYVDRRDIPPLPKRNR